MKCKFIKMDVSPGLVVLREDACLSSREFKTLHKYWMNIFPINLLLNVYWLFE